MNDLPNEIVLRLGYPAGPGFLPRLHLDVMRAAIELTTSRNVIAALETDGWWHETPPSPPGPRLLAALDEVVARVYYVRPRALVTRVVVSLAQTRSAR